MDINDNILLVHTDSVNEIAILLAVRVKKYRLNRKHLIKKI